MHPIMLQLYSLFYLSEPGLVVRLADRGHDDAAAAVLRVRHVQGQPRRRRARLLRRQALQRLLRRALHQLRRRQRPRPEVRPHLLHRRPELLRRHRHLRSERRRPLQRPQ